MAPFGTGPEASAAVFGCVSFQSNGLYQTEGNADGSAYCNSSSMAAPTDPVSPLFRWLSAPYAIQTEDFVGLYAWTSLDAPPVRGNL